MSAKSTRSAAAKLHRAAMERQRKINENLGYDALLRKISHRLEEKVTKKDILLGAVAYIDELENRLKLANATHPSSARPVLTPMPAPAPSSKPVMVASPPLQSTPVEPALENWFPALPQQFQQIQEDFGYVENFPTPIQEVETPAEPSRKGTKRVADEQENCYIEQEAKRQCLAEQSTLIVQHGYLFNTTTREYILPGPAPMQTPPVSNYAQWDYASADNSTYAPPQMYNYQY